MQKKCIIHCRVLLCFVNNLQRQIIYNRSITESHNYNYGRITDDWTAHVAFQIVKVDVTPWDRAGVNEFNVRILTDKLSNIPGITCHRLSAVAGCCFDSL